MVLPAKRHLAGKHLVYYHAERPDVRALVHLLPARLLRRHVSRRPQDYARDRGAHRERGRRRQVGPRWFIRECLRQPEVEHLDPAFRSQLDVRRLEIAVDHAFLVRIFQRVDELLDNRQSFARGMAPCAIRSSRVGPSASSITSARSSTP